MTANGGIYCIIPIGELYDEKIASSVRWRLRKLLGVKIRGLEQEPLNFYIKSYFKAMMDGLMGMDDGSTYERYAQLGIWVGDKGNVGDLSHKEFLKIREFASEIKDSFGYAVYHNGERVVSGNRTGGTDLSPRGRGIIAQFFDVNQRKSSLASDLNKKGWAIMIAVAHDVAARFEATGIYSDMKYRGQNQIVLSRLAANIVNFIKARLGRKSIRMQYGYILSRQGAGYTGRPFRVI